MVELGPLICPQVPLKNAEDGDRVAAIRLRVSFKVPAAHGHLSEVREAVELDVNLADLGHEEMSLTRPDGGIVYPDANTVPDTMAGCLLR